MSTDDGSEFEDEEDGPSEFRWLRALGGLCLIGVVLGFTLYGVRRWVAIEERLIEQRRRIDELTEQLAVPTKWRADTERVQALHVEELSELRAEAAQLHTRTDDVKHVLDALICVWPGRARLPRPMSDWPSWPKTRSCIGSIKDRDMRGPQPRVEIPEHMRSGR